MKAMHYPPHLKKLRHDLLDLMKRVRASMPPEQVSPDTAKMTEEWEGFFDGKSTRRVIIYLRSSGCAWAIKVGSSQHEPFRPGCFDCSHSVAGTTRGIPISADSYVRQFKTAFEQVDFSRSPMLCLYNEGSFFNEHELPREARRYMLQVIAADRHIQGLILESLPEYLNNTVLQETRNLLGTKYLEIGIGLESANQLVRDFCVNKSYTLQQYEQAAKLVKRHANLLAYVLVKPSFLTEAEALADSSATVAYAFRTGADVVSIEPVNTGDYNLCGVLHRLGLYRVPWLWTVLEVAKIAHQYGEVRIGGSQFAPQYERYAHNCPRCTQPIREAIRSFNGTNEMFYLQGLECSCLDEWQAELHAPHPALLERIAEALRVIHSQGGL